MPLTTAACASTADFLSSRKKIFEYMRDKEELVIEPFHRLVAEKQLIGYAYDGFWASMDTFKDRQQLEGLYSSGAAPWEVWKTNGKELGPRRFKKCYREVALRKVSCSH